MDIIQQVKQDQNKMTIDKQGWHTVIINIIQRSLSKF